MKVTYQVTLSIDADLKNGESADQWLKRHLKEFPEVLQYSELKEVHALLPKGDTIEVSMPLAHSDRQPDVS